MTTRSIAILFGLGATMSVAHASPRVGVMADVGVPDGAVASIVVRPTRMLRLDAGFGYNVVSTGARAGITFAPVAAWATPTVSVDYGHYAEGDANRLARMVTGDAPASPLLERVGYDYANVHLGFQFGHKRAQFYVRAGISRITSESLTGTMTTSEDAQLTIGDSRITMWAPSARLGLVLFLK